MEENKKALHNYQELIDKDAQSHNLKILGLDDKMIEVMREKNSLNEELGYVKGQLTEEKTISSKKLFENKSLADEISNYKREDEEKKDMILKLKKDLMLFNNQQGLKEKEYEANKVKFKL